MVALGESQKITKVNRSHPLGTRNVSTKCCGNPLLRYFSLNQSCGLTDNAIPNKKAPKWAKQRRFCGPDQPLVVFCKQVYYKVMLQ